MSNKNNLFYNPDVNFWEVNGNVRAIKEFNTFYEKDKSKGKLVSNKIMWAISFLHERDNNKFINYPIDERKQLIVENLFDVKDEFNWDKYEKLSEIYAKTCLDSLDRAINSLEIKLDERSKFLLETDYTLQSAKTLDDIFTATSKIQGLLDEMKAKRNKLDDDGQTKGGFKESASEKGLI